MSAVVTPALLAAAVVTVTVLATPAPHVAGQSLIALDSLPDYLLNPAEGLLKAASFACDILPLSGIFSRELRSELEDLEVVEARRGYRRSLRLLAAHHHLRPNAPLIIYIPGWWNTPDDEASQSLVTALLTHHPSVLILDTRLAFCRGYLSAATRVNAVSHLLYRFINNLNNIGIPPSAIHLIGFSLGAHVAGMTGKLVQKYMKTKVYRITALDPAKPCFGRTNLRLQKTDARFVQVVHSSVLGLEEPIGHVDVYMNGVETGQPECVGRGISFECDHNQSWRVFAESVIERRALLARRCRSWRELTAGACAGDLAPMGYTCSDHSRGMFLYKSKGWNDLQYGSYS